VKAPLSVLASVLVLVFQMTVDPRQLLFESDESDNSSRRRVRLPYTGAGCSLCAYEAHKEQPEGDDQGPGPPVHSPGRPGRDGTAGGEAEGPCREGHGRATADGRIRHGSVAL